MDDAIISISTGEMADPVTGRKTIHLEVTNDGNEPITLKKVEWVYFYERPVDATEEFISKHGKAFKQATGRTPIKVEETGRRYPFAPVEDGQDGPLAPKESRGFFYQSKWLPAMLSLALSLSPERYWIEITTNENQVDKLHGETFGAFLEEHFSAE